MKTIFFVVMMLIAFAGNALAQQSKWIIGSGQQDTLGTWNTFSTNNLRFYEVDFSGATPVGSARPIGNSISSIQSYGTSDPSGQFYDNNGNLVFYVFVAASTAANGNYLTAVADTIYVAEYNSITHKDEVTARFPTVKFGASVLEMDVINKNCLPTGANGDEYYIFYKTIASTYFADNINYVVYNHTTKTVSAPTSLANQVLTGEGMALSKKIANTQNRYFFYTEFDTSNFTVKIMESLVTPTGVSAPIVAAVSPAYPSSSYPNANPCWISVSPNGQYLAVNVYNGLSFTQDILLYDLNMPTGALTNFRYIDDPNGSTISFDFSPNSQKLYIYENTGTVIYYINVPSTNTSLASAPFLNITPYIHWGGCHMHTAFDGKIYFNPGFGTKTLLQISNPNTTPTLTPINAHLFGTYQWAGSDLPDPVDGDNYFVNKPLNIGRDTSICGAFSIKLKSIDSNTVWSNGIKDSQIVVTTAGTYSAYLVNNCDTIKDTIHITSGTAPTFSLGNDTSICGVISKTLQAGTYTATWSTGATANQIVVNSAGTYWAKVTNSCGTKRDTVVITALTPPNTNIGHDTAVCNGHSVTLSTSISPATYLWSTGATTSSISANTQGIYWLQITANSCSKRDTMNLTVQNPLLPFSLGNDTTFCHSFSKTLQAGTYTATWSTGATANQIVVTSAGTYWAKVTNSCGTKRDTVAITALTPPTVNIGHDTTVCHPNTVTLAASPSLTNYMWNTGAITPTITTNTQGWYWLQSTANTCTSRDSMYLKVDSLPTPFSLGHDTTICTNANLQLTANSPTAHWSTGATAKQIIINSAGKYWATVTNLCGSVSDTILIATVNPPAPIFIGNDTVFCGAFSKTLSTNIVNTHWSTGVIGNPIIVHTTGTYWATVSNACRTVSDTIHLSEIAAPKFSLGKDTSVCNGGSFKLGVAANLFPNATYHWQDNSTSNYINANVSGNYSLTVTNQCGSYTDAVQISILNTYCNIAIPNAFTPNGDGINDSFKPIIGCELPNYLFRVYNRWGQMLFETTDIKQGWNGIFNGQNEPLSVFDYYLSFYDVCQQKQQFMKGNVTLIR